MSKRVKVSPSGELMGEPPLVQPDYWEKYRNWSYEEELLLQQWLQAESDEESIT